MRHLARNTTLALIALLAAGGSALASHDRVPVRSVRALAFQLEEASASFHRAAEATAHHGSRAERDALVLAHGLDYRVRRFQNAVEARSPHSALARERLDLMLASYVQMVRAMDRLHPVPRVQRDFAEVGMLVDRLADAYGARLALSHRAHGAVIADARHRH